MTSASDSAAPLGAKSFAKSTEQPQQLRVLWPVMFVVLFWLAYAGIGLIDQPMFTAFLWRVALLLLLTVAMTAWWLANRRIGWKERLLVPAVAIASAVVATLCLHKTVLPPSVLIPTGQALITAWTIWLVLTLSAAARVRQAGLLAMGVLFWLPMTQVRMEGLRGDGAADLFWRSTPSAEENLLAELKQAPPVANVDGEGEGNRDGDGEVEIADAPPTIALAAADWAEFRGPQRSGIRQGVKIDTDWKTTPPKLLWRKAVGPAWSSVAIVGERLFTQQQRGPQEVVVCYAASSGEQLWQSAINERFEEPLGGIGPRATPTFAEGKIFAQGASGWLSCLDAATGDKLWSQNIADIAGTELPVWGYSSSPLVRDGLVFTYAGNKPRKATGAANSAAATPGLLALKADGGEFAWHAAIGKESYSSPQFVTLHDVPQLLYLSDTELTSLEPATGKLLWNFQNAGMGRPTVQPQLIAPNQLVISFSPDPGVSLLEIGRDGDTWIAREKWASRNMKPDFSDYLYHDGYLYGFDNDIFACISLADGKRMWKKGRYGAGQALLLADQPVLLVITERGEVVLVAVNPERHEELAKFQAIEGKTWNHPVVSRGRLYVRNAEEMACFELSPVD